uniref:Ribosomal protein L35Ae n=1 Tax=Aegilops tauschii subsp. strangulata TaxID=200361 RepID=A0A453R069_AEGTS
AMVKGRTGQRVRLYVRGTILGFKRSKSNQYESTSLVQVEGVNTKEDVAWYAGKRLAYVYKAKTKSNGTHYRCLWGKITRPHGNSGVVRAQFKSNLPAESMVSARPPLVFDVLLACLPVPFAEAVCCFAFVVCRGARSGCSCTRAASKVFSI